MENYIKDYELTTTNYIGKTIYNYIKLYTYYI